MLKLRKLAYVLLVLILVVGFVGCDDNGDNGDNGITTPTGITIFWSNQRDDTVDCYLDWQFVHRVGAGQTAISSGVSMGTHMLHYCFEGYEPGDVGFCEGEEYNLTGDFTYTMN